MVRLTGRRGFSLVELLTVIAIIAILASIIFPVMGMVNNKARMNKCITQLHQIGLGVQMFKQDNRRYPDILATTVQKDPTGKIIPFDRAGTNPDTKAPLGLFPEYVKSARLFHCPNSKYIDPTAHQTIPGDPNTPPYEFYPYDSYDFFIMPDNSVRQHFARGWTIIQGNETPAQAVRRVIPDDPNGSPPATGDATSDYERQLKFRTPPDNTVVTWCSAHEIINGNGFSGRAPILYLDGHVDQMNAQQVEDFRYRLIQKRE